MKKKNICNLFANKELVSLIYIDFPYQLPLIGLYSVSHSVVSDSL